MQSTPLWANSQIRRADIPFLDYKTTHSNLNTMEDVYDCESEKYLTWEQFVARNGIDVDFVTYNALINSIPRTWKHIARHMDHAATAHTMVELAHMDKNISKKYYWTYIEKHYPHNEACRIVWQKQLGVEIEEDQWAKILLSINNITNSTKLCLLQYKIMNNILTTNIRRAKWDKNISEYCSFCNQCKETVLHIFCECQKVKKLWHALEKWCEYYYKIDVKFDQSTIILNNYKGKEKKMINNIILCLKQSIYSTKCKQESLNFTNFVAYLDYWYQIEKTGAYISATVNKFNKKWKLYIQC